MFLRLPDRTLLRLLVVLVLLVSIGVYLAALFNDFVYDDVPQVVGNPWIKELKYLPDILFSDVWGFFGASTTNYYRPAMYVIYMINYHIFGLTPWGFHLINVLFHAGVSVLVLIITSKLIRMEADKPVLAREESPGRTRPQPDEPMNSVPFMAALLFATHPVHTEAVTWVAGLPEVSFTFFCLLSYFLYIRSRENPNMREAPYVLSVLSFALGILSKETAITLLIIFVAHDRVFGKPGEPFRAGVKRYLPYTLVTLGYFILRFYALGGFAPLKRHPELQMYENIVNILPLFAQYLGKLFFPINLTAFHIFHPLHSIMEMKAIISVAISAVILAIVILSWRKKGLILFGLLLFTVPLLPVLNVQWVGENAFTERYLYLPSFGFVMILAALLNQVAGRLFRDATRLSVVLFGALIVLYSAGTVARNSVWKNDASFFEDIIRKNPLSATPHIEFGNSLDYEGRLDEAIEQYRNAVRLEPLSVASHHKLGVALFKKGRVDDAIEQYSIALQLKPDDSQTHNDLGIALAEKGLYNKAIEHFEAAVRLVPDNKTLRKNLAKAYEQRELHR